MGHVIERVALSRGHEIVCKVDVDNPEAFESPEFADADVAIEFTAPSVAYDNVKKAFEKGVKVVCGTTGWFQDHSEEMKSLCEKGNTLFWSSNFSVGVAVFSAINRYLASIMNRFDGYNVDMSETHHCHKLDAPSGTAITLAETVVKELDRKKGWVSEVAPKGEVEHIVAQKDDDKLHITSFRHDEVPGIHSVRYESAADSITITHDAKSREGFALGAVLAAEFAANHNGLLTMRDLFDF